MCTATVTSWPSFIRSSFASTSAATSWNHAELAMLITPISCRAKMIRLSLLHLADAVAVIHVAFMPTTVAKTSVSRRPTKIILAPSLPDFMTSRRCTHSGMSVAAGASRSIGVWNFDVHFSIRHAHNYVALISAAMRGAPSSRRPKFIFYSSEETHILAAYDGAYSAVDITSVSRRTETICCGLNLPRIVTAFYVTLVTSTVHLTPPTRFT